MQQLKTNVINQKNITVEFDEIKNANYSFVNLDAEFNNSLNNYIQKCQGYFKLQNFASCTGL